VPRARVASWRIAVTLVCQAFRRPVGASAPSTSVWAAALMDHADVRPVVVGGDGGAGQVDDVPAENHSLVAVDGVEGPAELAVAAEDHGLPGGDGAGAGQERVVAVLVGQFRLFQWNRPRDREDRVGEVNERVLVEFVGRPVVVDQVRVGGVVGECLEGVADPAGHEDRLVGADRLGVHGTERGAFPQVHPGTEDHPGRHRDVLVPRLGMDAAGDPRASR
jgi:hypothetical protein